MKWQEKLSLASLCLVLIGWGSGISDSWPVLVAHLATSNWITLVLVHVGVLLMSMTAYAKAPKGTTARVLVVLATASMVASWSMYLSLIAKISSH
jgi:hypothetical protein